MGLLEVIPRRSQSGPIVASYSQQRLWFLQQLDLDATAYNVSGAVRIKGQLDVDILERSFHEILGRHEVLRTSIVMEEGELRQKIAPSLALPFTKVDLQSLPEAEREPRARQLAAEATVRSFDLADGPLFAITLYLLGNDEYVLLIVAHHTIADGWSIGVFMNELKAIYQAFIADQSSPLPELTLQYADFAFWQREQLQGEVLKTQLDYWVNRLQGAPLALEWPTNSLVHHNRRLEESVTVAGFPWRCLSN